RSGIGEFFPSTSAARPPVRPAAARRIEALTHATIGRAAVIAYLATGAEHATAGILPCPVPWPSARNAGARHPTRPLLSATAFAMPGTSIVKIFARPGRMLDRIGPLIVAAAALAGCEENVVPEWCIAPEDVAVRLASEPGAWGSPPELSPEWRVDGAAQGQELVLPTSAAVSGAAGRIALVDFGL